VVAKDAIAQGRIQHSQLKLTQLRKELGRLSVLERFPTLGIFAAGSYGRLEACDYSDIDLFFIDAADRGDIAELHTNELRLFAKVIDIADDMGFPKFSNDCQYLTVLHKNDILRNLGSPTDDHQNYFTARMLLLLESQCLYGDANYDSTTADIVGSYFKDFPHHRQTFQPVFLLNDICRFWKTMLLNYENKRQMRPGTEESEEQKTKRRVRNFKLKYSRMTTCFASVAALGSYRVPVTEKNVLELTKLTPRQRLESVPERLGETAPAVKAVLGEYSRFLEMTGLPTEGLEDHFSDTQKRSEMFARANKYGDAMFALLRKIDATATDEKYRLLRYLVI